ncbi:hypothetical protein FG91_01632 [Sphingopyxis sp. LC81]|uniref:surface lipoprotein assembly modifier n=1 Tax=Sphingopyxis sp. LC81 TaxID=1502850 RepID=UPI00050F95E7|nr:surface lipoprotein assembly modifier [Sphingopyxis sp. LC81]KGB55003.1 hypothetical protein FG91_01632 [Sphingopyxis sp. LC81]
MKYSFKVGHIRRFRLFALTFSALMVQPPSAYANPESAESKASLSGEIQLGAQYDSNVSVDDIDSNVGRGDWAALLEARANLKTDLSRKTSLRLSYAFSQSLYESFTDFDLQTHLGSADISHGFGRVRIGAAGRLAHSRLGGDGFLTTQQFSPYVSFRASSSLLLRVDYSHANKNFIGRADRDARNNAATANVYYFVNGTRTYFQAGYSYAHENAEAAPFDYEAQGFQLRFNQKLAIGSNDATLRLGWRYDRRNYDEITPAIQAERRERRHRLQANVELPVSKKIFLSGGYEYTDRNSNLPSANYNQHLVSLMLGARF